MRAGRLKKRLRLLTGTQLIRGVWADVRPPLDVGEQTGLREAGRTKVIVRPDSRFKSGLLLEGQGEWYVIDGLGDRFSRGQELHLSCTRLLGESAEYQDVQNNSVATVAAVFKNTPYVGLDGNVMEHQYRIEIPSGHQPSRFSLGDVIKIGLNSYSLLGIEEGGDDGTVIRYMA